MIQKTFNLTSTFKSEPQEDGSIMVRGMASTNAFDRAGDSISAEAWTKGGLGNFEKNPIILFNHDYNRPIGRATKVTPTADGLHMEAKISKHADCADLIKDGVLGAFSVGFKVKDADYLEETDGLMIKDAELFEVSVVTVPCNQAATFSLAKSFDSEQDYEDFKKTFKSEEDSSLMETDMSEEIKTPEIDLDAFAKKVAEETAAKIAIRQAEEKATVEAEAKAAAEEAEVQKAAEAEAEKAAAEQQEKVEQSIRTGIESGADRLVADLRKEFEQKDAETQEILAKYKNELQEKGEEIRAMQNSKKQFADRGQIMTLETTGAQELLEAKILGTMMRRSWDTDFTKQVFQKHGADIDALANSGAGANLQGVKLDLIVETQFEKELQQELRAAQFFREIPVQTKQTILPIMPDSVAATFNTGSASDESNSPANLNDLTRGTAATNNKFSTGQKVLIAGRLSSTTYIDNDTDEMTLVALLPMIREAMVRAHARALDTMVISGTGTSGGAAEFGVLDKDSGTSQTVTGGSAAANTEKLVGDDILTARAAMKKYGMNPQDLVLICSYNAYNDLLQDAGFADITDVGSDLATKISGVMGSIFATPVVVTDHAAATGLPAVRGSASDCAVLVNHKNFVIPRLRGVSIESEYQVGNQRNALVASQSLGFEQLVEGNATTGFASVVFAYAA